MGDLAAQLAAGPQQFRATTPARILTFDIETRPGEAYFWQAKTRYIPPSQVKVKPSMFSFAAKWYGEKSVEFRSTFHDDRATMLDRIRALLDEADIVVGFNSDRFDVRWVKAELARDGMPPFAPFRSVDLIKTARSQFYFPHNHLNEIAAEFGLKGKMAHQGFGLWVDCMADDPTAWATMKRYNIRDVRLTEQVYDAMRPWIPNHPNLGLWAGHDDDGRPIEVCCNCGHGELERVTKNAHTALTAYGLVKCKKCGVYMRRNFVKERVTLRAAR